MGYGHNVGSTFAHMDITWAVNLRVSGAQRNLEHLLQISK